MAGQSIQFAWTRLLQSHVRPEAPEVLEAPEVAGAPEDPGVPAVKKTAAAVASGNTQEYRPRCESRPRRETVGKYH